MHLPDIFSALAKVLDAPERLDALRNYNLMWPFLFIQKADVACVFSAVAMLSILFAQ